MWNIIIYTLIKCSLFYFNLPPSSGLQGPFRLYHRQSPKGGGSLLSTEGHDPWWFFVVAFFWQIVVRVDNDDGDNDNDDGNGDNDNDNGDGTHRKSFLRRHLDHAAQQVLTIGRHEVGNVEHPALYLHEIEIERVNFFLSIINQVWTLIIRWH